MKPKSRLAGFPQPRDLLDSYAMLMLLNEEPGYEKVQQRLMQAERNERLVFMSAINVGETYYIVHRTSGEFAAEKFLRILEATTVTISVPTQELIIAAAKIKAKYPISYADAIAVATAIEVNASILTGDPEFQKIEGIAKVEWLQRKTSQ